MTETNGIITSLVGKDYVDNVSSRFPRLKPNAQPTSVGYPSPIVDIRIVDPETRQEVPRGKTGLVICRGSMVMKEYVGNPEATAESLDKDGWFNTGDLAMQNAQGWIFIQDRAKDMIIRGGENVSCTITV